MTDENELTDQPAETTTVEETPAEPEVAGEEVATKETPAPDATAVVSDAPDAVLLEGVAGGLTWLPFAAYLGLWALLCAASAYLLSSPAADGQAARWLEMYVPLLWIGLALTLAGPVLALVVWLVARSRRDADARVGLLACALSRGALATFFGVALWIATLSVLDLVATGRLSS